MNNYIDFLTYLHRDEGTTIRRWWAEKGCPARLPKGMGVERANETSCIFYQPNLDGITNAVISRFYAVYVEVDPVDEDVANYKARKLREFQQFKPKPTMIFESKKSIHGYWCLDRPLVGRDGSTKNSLWRSLQKKLAFNFEGDDAPCSPHQPMRLPFTYHRKNPAEPFFFDLVEFNDVRYTIEELADALDHVHVPTDWKCPGKRATEAKRETALATVDSDESNETRMPASSAVKTFHGDHVAMIREGKVEALQAALNPEPRSVDSADELHDLLTKSC